MCRYVLCVGTSRTAASSVGVNGSVANNPQACCPGHSVMIARPSSWPNVRSNQLLFEERIVQGETVWVAIRARGAEWSWLTPAEAARLGQQWVEKYGGESLSEP